MDVPDSEDEDELPRTVLEVGHVQGNDVLWTNDMPKARDPDGGWDVECVLRKVNEYRRQAAFRAWKLSGVAPADEQVKPGI